MHSTWVEVCWEQSQQLGQQLLKPRALGVVRQRTIPVSQNEGQQLQQPFQPP